MAAEDETRDRDEKPYPDGPRDEHTEFVDSPAEPTDQDADGAQTGLGAGATAGASDPDAGSDAADEDGDDPDAAEPAGSAAAEAARPPRGAPPS